MNDHTLTHGRFHYCMDFESLSSFYLIKIDICVHIYYYNLILYAYNPDFEIYFVRCVDIGHVILIVVTYHDTHGGIVVTCWCLVVLRIPWTQTYWSWHFRPTDSRFKKIFRPRNFQSPKLLAQILFWKSQIWYGGSFRSIQVFDIFPKPCIYP